MKGSFYGNLSGSYIDAITSILGAPVSWNMKFFETLVNFGYSWSDVANALIRRYPNPYRWISIQWTAFSTVSLTPFPLLYFASIIATFTTVNSALIFYHVCKCWLIFLSVIVSMFSLRMSLIDVWKMESYIQWNCWPRLIIYQNGARDSTRDQALLPSSKNLL